MERGILFDRKHSGKRKIILQRINNTSIASIASKPFENQCSMVDANHSNNITLASIASKYSDTNDLDAKDDKDGNSYIDNLFSSVGL